MPALLSFEFPIKWITPYTVNNNIINEITKIITPLTMLFSLVLLYLNRRKITKDDQPYAIFLVVAFISEITIKVVIYLGFQSAVNANIYVLVEFPILLWLFYNWSSKKNRSIFISLFVAGLIIWIFDNFILGTIYKFSSYYRVYYSIVLIFCSINQINKIIFSEHISLWLNAYFLICLTSVIYYSYRIFIESLFLFQTEMSIDFFKNVYSIMLIVNFFAHLIYTLAILCIPTRREFTLQY